MNAHSIYKLKILKYCGGGGINIFFTYALLIKLLQYYLLFYNIFTYIIHFYIYSIIFEYVFPVFSITTVGLIILEKSIQTYMVFSNCLRIFKSDYRWRNEKKEGGGASSTSTRS